MFNVPQTSARHFMCMKSCTAYQPEQTKRARGQTEPACMLRSCAPVALGLTPCARRSPLSIQLVVRSRSTESAAHCVSLRRRNRGCTYIYRLVEMAESPVLAKNKAIMTGFITCRLLFDGTQNSRAATWLASSMHPAFDSGVQDAEFSVGQGFLVSFTQTPTSPTVLLPLAT